MQESGCRRNAPSCPSARADSTPKKRRTPSSRSSATEVPGQAPAKLGHYVVGNIGNVDANGCTATLRTVIANRVRGSLEYSVANAEMFPATDLRYLVLISPSALQSSRERIQDFAARIE